MKTPTAAADGSHLNRRSAGIRLRLRCCAPAVTAFLLVAGSFLFPAEVFAADDRAKFHPKKEQVEALYREKAARSPAQQKLDSKLLFAARKHRGEAPVPGVPTLNVSIPTDPSGRVHVQIRGEITTHLVAECEKHGGSVLKSFPEYQSLYATIPLKRLEKLAERADVWWIAPPAEAQTNSGEVDSEGDQAHAAAGSAGARARFGARGQGVRVGVLSDGVDSLAEVQAAGELPSVTVLDPGTGNEGTAMMEIVYDIAPEAQLFYATGGDAPEDMARNIRALANAPHNCSIIIDDVSFFDESPFQDGPIAQAVNEVSDKGVLYFTSAANSGNKASNTSSTWEGDFVDGGPAIGGLAGRVHSFGSQNFNTNLPHRDGRVVKSRIDLFWNDPLGKSSNDYDLVVTNDAGDITDTSLNAQRWDSTKPATVNPYEWVRAGENGAGARIEGGRSGTRIHILKADNAAARFLHLSTSRNPLQFSTTGSTRGHNASGAANAFSVAAAPAAIAHDAGHPAGPGPSPFTTASQFEKFSSDGPRRMFYRPDGTPFSSNLTSSGGLKLDKPDITAADGVATFVENNVGPNPPAGTKKDKSFSPFFGTSAAAPHAGAIAALLKSKFPAATPAQLRDALVGTALDIGPAGRDDTTGAGIVMPLPALTRLASPPTHISLVGPPPDYPENPNRVVQDPADGNSTGIQVYVQVTGAPAGGGQVRVFTQDGTAVANNDYRVVDFMLSYPAGDSRHSVSSAVHGKTYSPPANRNFTINLGTSTNGTITRGQALVTILDTPSPAVSLRLMEEQLIEGRAFAKVNDGTVHATFGIELSGPSDREVRVNATASPRSARAGAPERDDYLHTSTTVTFEPGQTRKFVRVPVYNTRMRNEAEETFALNLATPLNATIADGEGICTIHQNPVPGPAVNISTRMRVLNGDNVLIGGFIITGRDAKDVIIRGLGPSLAGTVPDALADPVLTLMEGSRVILTVDNWTEYREQIRASGIPPSHDLESAMIVALQPGAYTVILSEKNGGRGVGLVEVYDLQLQSDSELANISTRGFVDTGDNVMIGGFIIGANAESGPSRVIVRALGPSLAVAGRLENPTLEIYNASGTQIASNDNWKDTQESDIRLTTVPPSHDLEAAVVGTVNPGAYTAIVRGKDNSVGIGLVEVYQLD